MSIDATYMHDGTALVPTTEHHVWDGFTWVAPKMWDGSAWANLDSAAPPDPGGGEFVLGETKPDSTNTGVPSGTVLTTVVGDVVISTSDYVLENKDIYGFVRVTSGAANVTIRNCRIRGRDTGLQAGCLISGTALPRCWDSDAGTGDAAGTPLGYSNPYSRQWPGWYGLIDLRGAGGSVTSGDRSTGGTATKIIRCTLKPDYPSWWLGGIDAGSKSFHAERNDVSHCQDSIAGATMNVFGNYVHDHIWVDNSYNHRNWSPPPPAWYCHPDMVACVATSEGAHIIGNHLDSQAGNYAKVGGVWTALGKGADDILTTWSPNGDQNNSPRNKYRKDSVGDGQPGRSGACVTLANGAFANMLITKNWMYAGEAAVQQSKADGSTTVGEVSYNRVNCEGDKQIRHTSSVTYLLETTNYFDPDDPYGSVQAFGLEGQNCSTANGGITYDPANP